MPLFMNIHHKVEGLTGDAVAHAHELDLKTQGKYGVKYLKYWYDEATGKVFCLVEAPKRGRHHRSPRGARPGRRRDHRGQGGRLATRQPNNHIRVRRGVQLNAPTMHKLSLYGRCHAHESL